MSPRITLITSSLLTLLLKIEYGLSFRTFLILLPLVALVAEAGRRHFFCGGILPNWAEGDAKQEQPAIPIKAETDEIEEPVLPGSVPAPRTQSHSSSSQQRADTLRQRRSGAPPPTSLPATSRRRATSNTGNHQHARSPSPIPPTNSIPLTAPAAASNSPFRSAFERTRTLETELAEQEARERGLQQAVRSRQQEEQNEEEGTEGWEDAREQGQEGMDLDSMHEDDRRGRPTAYPAQSRKKRPLSPQSATRSTFSQANRNASGRPVRDVRRRFADAEPSGSEGGEGDDMALDEDSDAAPAAGTSYSRGQKSKKKRDIDDVELDGGERVVSGRGYAKRGRRGEAATHGNEDYEGQEDDDMDLDDSRDFDEDDEEAHGMDQDDEPYEYSQGELEDDAMQSQDDDGEDSDGYLPPPNIRHSSSNGPVNGNATLRLRPSASSSSLPQHKKKLTSAKDAALAAKGKAVSSAAAAAHKAKQGSGSLAGGKERQRKKGEVWTEGGKQFRINGDTGKKEQLVEIKEWRKKFVMPADSKHPDAKLKKKVRVEKWITDDQLEELKGQKMLGEQLSSDEESNKAGSPASYAGVRPRNLYNMQSPSYAATPVSPTGAMGYSSGSMRTATPTRRALSLAASRAESPIASSMSTPLRRGGALPGTPSLLSGASAKLAHVSAHPGAHQLRKSSLGPSRSGSAGPQTRTVTKEEQMLKQNLLLERLGHAKPGSSENKTVSATPPPAMAATAIAQPTAQASGSGSSFSFGAPAAATPSTAPSDVSRGPAPSPFNLPTKATDSTAASNTDKPTTNLFGDKTAKPTVATPAELGKPAAPATVLPITAAKPTAAEASKAAPAAAPAPFSFMAGSTAPGSTLPSPAPLFAFGGSAPASKPAESAQTAANFPAMGSTPAPTAPKPMTGLGLSMGSESNAAVHAPLAGAASSKPGIFNFGAPAAASAPTAALQAQNQVPAAPTPAPAQTGGFNFGKAAPAPGSSSFNFGSASGTPAPAMASTPAQPAAPTPFSFSAPASATPPPAFQFGSGSPAPATNNPSSRTASPAPPAFQFGAPAAGSATAPAPAAPPKPATAFQFGSNNASAGAPFNFGSGGGASGAFTFSVGKQ